MTRKLTKERRDDIRRGVKTSVTSGHLYGVSSVEIHNLLTDLDEADREREVDQWVAAQQIVELRAKLAEVEARIKVQDEMLKTHDHFLDRVEELQALREVERAFSDEISKWWYHPNYAGSFDRTLKAIAAVDALRKGD